MTQKHNEQKHIQISIEKQTLQLFEGEDLLKQYTISTAKNGPGEMMDSECTPRGEHVIREKIGEGCKANTVFVGRQPTGELYHPELREQFPDRDWILTRILWLGGCVEGQNKGKNQTGNVDSYERYIYIHGSPDDVAMGTPGSRGCVRMRNDDIIEFFELVETDTPVNIA